MIRKSKFLGLARIAMRKEQDTELLHSELLSLEQLKRHAVMLASQHNVDPHPGPDKLLPRLVDNERVLLSAYDVVTEAVTQGQRIAPAEAWLLDNFYLIEQQIRLARRHLPRGYSRELPRLATGPLVGFPRVYELAYELISHQDGRLDTDNVTNLVSAYQSVEFLRLGELWAFPIMLQLALLENLRRVGLRIARLREERDIAIAWADRMLETAERRPRRVAQVLADLANADVPLTAPFVEEFYTRLQAQGSALAFVQTWVEHQLFEQGVTVAQVSQAASLKAAANQISIANSINALRFIVSMDWKEFVETLSTVELTLREDPNGSYADQDFATRDRYRHVIEDMAKGSPMQEWEVARETVQLARIAAERLGKNDRSAHIGYYLIDRGRRSLERIVNYRSWWKSQATHMGQNPRLFFYLGPIFLFIALTEILVLFALDELGWHDWRYEFLAIAGLVSASALAVSLVNMLVTFILPPRSLPRMNFSSGVPTDQRTMVVVPTLLSNSKEIGEVVENLEIRYLGNRDSNVLFALLTDFNDASQQTQPDDDELLAIARRGIQSLNEKHCEERPCIFYLFHRSRVWNPYEKLWMGYERKRGKLEQFNALLRDEEGEGFSEIVGDRATIGVIKYVITLDTDTQLPRDVARMLIAAIAHPLNRPIYDVDKGRVVAGYAILQPRAVISWSSAGRSRFTRLFAGESGIDPYTREVSDVYQDIFGEGSYVGKGIYDVDAFRQAVDGRFPENLILSHDLLESGYARSALVADVNLIEEHPASYTTEASRRHRWIRGDWQIAGWLLWRSPGPNQKRQPNPLTLLSAWKIFDNLRRSLVAPALLLLLTGGWLTGIRSAFFWILLIAGVVLIPPMLGVLIQLVRKPRERTWLLHLSVTIGSAARPMALAALTLVFLPYEVLICLDAILYSGIRMMFTRRGLLLWHMATYVHRNARDTLYDFYAEMWIAPVLAITLAIGLEYIRPSEWLLWGSMTLLWFISPAVAWWISRPLRPHVASLNAEQQIFLHMLARVTWRYFEDFVTAQDNWLPPDNFQEYPIPTIATRTSPTNIGMALLANLAAHDFGYIDTESFLRRTENTLVTMEKLERYRGHFYNWYDTRTLKPLRPQYISSVDSGNLASCLVTLVTGLGELRDQPLVVSSMFQGLSDTLFMFANHVSVSSSQEFIKQIASLQNILAVRPETPVVIAETLDKVHHAYERLFATVPTDMDDEGRYWLQTCERQWRQFRDDIESLLPDQQRLEMIPTLIQMVEEGSSEIVQERVASAHKRAVERLKLIDNLISRCRELAMMDFEFLYDNSRNLLFIGYNVTDRRRDPSCYDLLASEARVASFLLIAQGQVPQKHWFALGRTLTNYRGYVSLLSWSGSMFEYLMPQLIMRSYEHTLLDETCKAVVLRQIEYGQQRGVPWGISESCYNATDAHQTYQYQSFGVPGLGFKRGLGEDLVIAPYASTLALTVMPRDACRNLQTLAANGFLGDYGFYEAIDYTPSRIPRGKNHAIVRTFMSHHQGMSLLAFEHVLLNAAMQRRFMADPLVKATELLLQERVPKTEATTHPHVAEVSASARPPVAEEGAITRVFRDPNTSNPEVHLLSNGRYHVMVTNAGGGYSRWRDLAITRWREDATRDCWGTFIYLRDRDNGHYWSATYQPTLKKADRYEAIFVQARAEYRRTDQAIETYTEISVSPEDDVEIRRVTLTNRSSRVRYIEITTYTEVILAPPNAELAHPVFNSLFLETEILPDRQAILCTRRRRAPNEKTPWMFHLFAARGVIADDPSYETDRARFIGRARTTVNPIALEDSGVQRPGTLSNTAGSVLDPIAAIRRTLTLTPDESVTVHIISGAMDTRDEALVMLEKYSDKHFINRAFEMAWFQSQEVLRYLDTTESEAQIYGQLATSVVFANGLHRVVPSVISRNRLGQSGLWRFAVSGDLPIILVSIADIGRIDLIKRIIRAHAYWRMNGLIADLVIINEDFSGYRTALNDQIMALINSGPDAQFIDKPGGVFVRRAEQLSEEERVLFQSVARVVLIDSAETMTEQVQRRVPTERLPSLFAPVAQPSSETVKPLSKRELIFFNGLGGFTPDGREYVITLALNQNTPTPWCNVIASPKIGTVVSDCGSAYTWVENAHDFRLTTWHNDPLCDSSGEALYIRDEETGVFWSPTVLPARGRSGYVCRHGFGYSVFEHVEGGIFSELSIYVAMDAPIKFSVVKLRNQSSRTRRLSLTGYWELVLGEWRHANLMHIVTEIDAQTGALFARNAYGREWADRIIFLQVSEPTRTVTGNRMEFIGRNGSLATPVALRRKRLSGKIGAGLDPCAAMQTQIELTPGQEREVVFIFGAAHTVDEAQRLVQQFGKPGGAKLAYEAVWEYWNHTLGTIHVETPNPALNVLANGWLIYQILSSRFWGRSGYYQSGGAYGFRDQLQDVMALIHATPSLVREHLIRCAERQFHKGDVQHWWNPPSGRGVRTQFSDDFLWLPYATCRYVFATGDTGILDEQVHFLEGRELTSEEEAYYDQPQRSTEVSSLYEHCVRAIRNGLRFGIHNLPLMGCGDWNDAMNLVGRQGKGESVWLAWFLYHNLQLFSKLAQARSDNEFSQFCMERSEQLRISIEANAWDGDWYRRAYFDDGTPLGSSSNDECQIDSISQSWAVISGGGDPNRARQAMAAVDRRLVNRDAQLIRLLDPPFDKSVLEPGYIKGYIPGVRENGGHYTHGAIWTTMAFAMMGDKERAWELFSMLNPIHHGSRSEDIDTYKVEPYVMSADIYATPPHTGRGGWTWYTGSAGWMYRLALETLLGIELEIDRLRFTPRIPKNWETYKIHYRYRETIYHITVRRVGKTTDRVTRVAVDDIEQPESVISVSDDHREHHVEIDLG